MTLTKKIPFFALLGLLMLAGLVAGHQQLVEGLHVTGLHEPVVWGLYVVCFVYFAGIGAGSLTVASAAICSARDEYRPLARSASIVAFVSLAIAGIFITIDLGRPDRAILLLLKGKPQSPLVWDFIILNALIGVAALYLFARLRLDVTARGQTNPTLLTRLLTVGSHWLTRERVARLLRLVAGIMVVGVPVLYLLTVRVFAVLRARPGWNATGLGPIFLVSGLVSGMAAVVVFMGLTGELRRSERARQVARLIGASLIFLIAIDIVLSLTPFVTMRQFDAAAPGVGALHPLAVLELALGLVAPLLILAATRNRRRPWLAIPGLLILVGVFIKRWDIIIPAMRQRSLPLPAASYSPTVVEYAQAMGIVAFGVLLSRALQMVVTRVDTLQEHEKLETQSTPETQ